MFCLLRCNIGFLFSPLASTCDPFPGPSTTTAFFIHMTIISYRFHDFYFAVLSFFLSFFTLSSPSSDSPLLGPSPGIRQSLDALRVLPQMSICRTLSLGFPTARLDGRLQAAHARRPELDVGAGHAVASHDAGGVFVPDAAEHVEAHGGEAELVAEGLEGEAVARGVQLLEFCNVERGVGLLLEEVDAQAVVGAALLGGGRQPGHGELVGGADPAQRERGVVWAERDVGGEEVAALGEGVLFDVGHVRVEHDEGDEPRALVEDLDAQAGRVLADEGVDNLAGGDLGLAEVELDVGDGVELGEHVGDNVELLDALGDEAVVVRAPFALGVVPVDGLVHVSWRVILLVIFSRFHKGYSINLLLPRPSSKRFLTRGSLISARILSCSTWRLKLASFVSFIACPPLSSAASFISSSEIFSSSS